MTGNYTQETFERIEDLVESEAAEIWADIDLEAGTDIDKWRAKLESIAREYAMTSRFALMRILHDRVYSYVKDQGGVQDQHDGIEADESSFEVPVGQDRIAFRDISVEHAQNLSVSEHLAYIRYLREIAGPSPEEDPDLHERLIDRAWFDEQSANAVAKALLPPNTADDSRRLLRAEAKLEKENSRKYGSAFTREEALKLGHILGFSLVEMQNYLMRVFDVEDCLRMTRASDLIDCYGFMSGASCLRVERLKRQYNELAYKIEKVDDPGRWANWTRKTTSDLVETFESWQRYPETMDDNFLAWMKNHVSGLDIPSRTARRVYRNLAVYAYTRATGNAAIPDEDKILEELQQITELDGECSDTISALYKDGSVSADKCRDVARLLYSENKLHSELEWKDSTLAWAVVTTRQDGTLSSSYGKVNFSRTRIQSLLMGAEEVEKGDLLYLLWFTLNLTWGDAPADDSNVLYCRLFDLKDAADMLLEKAMLPPFYPPHLMEQSMMLSIIYGGKTGTEPGVVYGTMLQSTKDTRSRAAGSRKHTLQEKIDIVRQYQNGMTLQQCALLNGISEKTLSQWQKELAAQGRLSQKE